MKNLEQIFVELVRLGIGKKEVDTGCLIFTSQIDWESLMILANTQGLSAIILDGIEKLPVSLRLPKILLLQWIGSSLQNYEYRYDLYCRTIAEMAGFYNEHHFKMMVLKGFASSLYWPKPEHRPYGDIDIWLFGRQKEADKVLSNEKRIQIDNSHHHHTVFFLHDFMVENHYDFINIHHHKSSVKIEKIFKQLGQDDRCSVTLFGEKVYLPSPNLSALFLLRHALIEFASTGINFRQVLDWAFFIEKRGKELDWKWLLKQIDEFYMRNFYNVLNTICVEDLGFSTEIFPSFQYQSETRVRVIRDIFSLELCKSEPKDTLSRLIFKFKRWKANGWKHKLCYKESMWSGFWYGVWNHILKPASI